MQYANSQKNTYTVKQIVSVHSYTVSKNRHTLSKSKDKYTKRNIGTVKKRKYTLSKKMTNSLKKTKIHTLKKQRNTLSKNNYIQSPKKRHAVLFKRMRRSLRSFSFFIKERNVFCVFFGSL